MKIKSVKADWLHVPIPEQQQHTSDFGKPDPSIARLSELRWKAVSLDLAKRKRPLAVLGPMQRSTRWWKTSWVRF